MPDTAILDRARELLQRIDDLPPGDRKLIKSVLDPMIRMLLVVAQIRASSNDLTPAGKDLVSIAESQLNGALTTLEIFARPEYGPLTRGNKTPEPPLHHEL